MTVNEALKILESVFGDEKAITAKSVWEKDGEKYKYVLTAHGLLSGNKPVLLSKFILWADENKLELVSKNLTWLYDVNCVYRSVQFDNETSLKSAAEKILKDYVFGNNLRTLSELSLLGTASKMNDCLAGKGIKNMSVHSFTYQPLHTVKPCEATTFDYKLSLNGEHEIQMSVRKDGSTFKIDAVLGSERTTVEMAYAERFIDNACDAIIKLVNK